MWDFEQPLVTETGAEQAVNSFLSKIDGGTKMTDASWTNTVAALGNTSLAALCLVWHPVSSGWWVN
jgi:hypothetical protein